MKGEIKMLATSSIKLETENFEEAFAKMPETPKVQVRYLKDEHGEDVGVYQFKIAQQEKWSSPKMLKTDSQGSIIPIDFNAKRKLENAKLFYDFYTTPQYVGSNETQSWMIGDIDGCKILGDEYKVQGIMISTIFDPTPKYYISFERLVCENAFSSLGHNNASMYIDMNAFLRQDVYNNDEMKVKLSNLIQSECEKRIDEANKIYNKLAITRLSDEQVREMFAMLTINKVAKTNQEKYKEAEEQYSRYIKVYNSDDNQNYKGSLFGFVNACTNIRTRTKTNPLDVIKPVLSADVVNSPCNFDYLCRAAMLNRVG